MMVVAIENADDVNLEKRVISDLKNSERMQGRNERRAFGIINRGLNRKLKDIKRRQKELEKEKDKRNFFSKL